MKAMIFAAGLGTRLKPFTLEHPKALVPVAGIPMLQRVIQKLQSIGVNEFVVNVHHFASQIVDFLRDNDNFGAVIAISDESDELLDTGGGILAARKWLDGSEPFIVHNADILTDVDIPAMVSAHVGSGAMATLLVAQRNTQRYLLFDPKSRMMRGWTNIATGQTLPEGLEPQGLDMRAFAGIHVLSPGVFPLLEAYAKEIDKDAFSIIPFYISSCQGHLIQGFVQATPYNWYDAGKPETLERASEWLKNP